MFSPKSFIVLALTCRSLIHFEVILYMLQRRDPNIAFLWVDIQLSQHDLLRRLQWTPEQHGFELHRVTYTQVFSVVNTLVLLDPLLVESTDAEARISMAQCSYLQIFSCLGGQVLNPQVI